MEAEQGLEGYAEYKKKVKYRILPFVWRLKKNEAKPTLIKIVNFDYRGG